MQTVFFDDIIIQIKMSHLQARIKFNFSEGGWTKMIIKILNFVEKEIIYQLHRSAHISMLHQQATQPTLDICFF